MLYLFETTPSNDSINGHVLVKCDDDYTAFQLVRDQLRNRNIQIDVFMSIDFLENLSRLQKAMYKSFILMKKFQLADNDVWNKGIISFSYMER